MESATRRNDIIDLIVDEVTNVYKSLGRSKNWPQSFKGAIQHFSNGFEALRGEGGHFLLGSLCHEKGTPNKIFFIQVKKSEQTNKGQSDQPQGNCL